MKSLSILVFLLATVVMPFSAQAQTYPQPWRIYANVEYEVGYMGCVVRIQHGQYGAYGFANINRIVSRRNGCTGAFSRVWANQGQTFGKGSDGRSAIALGTETNARFIILGTKYGLTCLLYIDVNADGAWSSRTFYGAGYGTCPTTAAWIRRIWR